jgi:predicted O-methyltransferase YrrM
MAARSIGARRVMELGSGYGYSAYWFARAVGAAGEVVCTDGDADNAARAEAYLADAGLWDRVRYGVGDALTGFAAEEGEFDIVYCDVDKGGYPDCWRAARDRIRIGGLWLCDNVIWDGHVARGTDREGLPGWSAAIREHNDLVAAPAERFDVVIDFSAYPVGTEVTMINRLGVGSTDAVLKFRVVGKAADDSAIPAKLSHPASRLSLAVPCRQLATRRTIRAQPERRISGSSPSTTPSGVLRSSCFI